MMQKKSRLFAFGAVTFMCAALALLRFGDALQKKPIVIQNTTHNAIHKSSTPSRLVTRPCAASPSHQHKLECYWFLTGEEPNKAFELPVVVFKSFKSIADPLVYISGGPGVTGSTSKNSISYWDDWLAEANLNRDFILVGLRGAEPSKPTLSCKEYDVVSKQLIKEDLTFAQEYERLNPIINECLAVLSGKFENGLFDFNSLKNAQDLAGVLSALGYSSWNYLGVSYGTRVALVAALTQPQVKSIILDSPYPLSRGRLSDVPTVWNNALEQFFLVQGQDLKSQFYSVKSHLT